MISSNFPETLRSKNSHPPVSSGEFLHPTAGAADSQVATAESRAECTASGSRQGGLGGFLRVEKHDKRGSKGKGPSFASWMIFTLLGLKAFKWNWMNF